MSSYDYGHNTPDDALVGKKQTESEILSWLLIFFCFVVFWPLGLFLLIRKLSGDKRKRRSKVQQPAELVCRRDGLRLRSRGWREPRGRLSRCAVHPSAREGPAGH